MKSNKYLLYIPCICCVLTIGMGVISLLGWLSGLRILASIHSHYIPMAPNTAVAFIVMGIAASVLYRLPLHHISRWMSALLSLCVVTLGTLTLLHYFHVIVYDINLALVKSSGGTFGNVPVGYMSPLTAGNFILAGASLFLLTLSSSGKPIRNIASCLAATVTVVGSLVMLGYLYGSPILYGSSTVPMAINTACAFVLTGISLIQLAGLECIPAHYFAGVSVRARLMRVFFPIIMLTTLITHSVHTIALTKGSFNPAMVIGVNTVLFAGFIGFIVFLISKMVGGSIDRAEAMRAHTEEKVIKIAESMFDAIIMIDENGVINYWNNAAETILGYTKDEALGKYVHTLLLPEACIESYRNGMKTFKANGTGAFMGKRIVLPARRKDGSQFCAEHSFATFQTDNGWNAVSVMRDCTERKRYEDELNKLNETLEQRVAERTEELFVKEEEQQKLKEQLYHAQKLESVGRLAGGIAHDFNNKLMAIMGYSELAEAEIAEGNPAKDYVKKILESSMKATELTQSLLVFSRRQPVSLSPVNLNSIVGYIERLLLKTVGENIDCKLTLTDKDIKVFADSDKIEQVLMNLANNAVDAMPDGGSLTIGTDVVVLDSKSANVHGLDKDGAYGVITVSDTGMGMDEEIQRKIFEPFFTTKERGKGTGLGLAIVYGIVKQHHGHIEVISEPGKGAVFKIYLPTPTPTPTPTKKVLDTTLSAKVKTILVAEDDEDVRALVIRILESSGYHVISAINGDDVIKRFEEHKDKIDMLLFDVMMPKKGGKDAYNSIKKRRPDIKVLFMSGYSENIITNKEIREEGLTFIQKPMSSDELLKKIEELWQTT